jgi:hypothetical protein
LSLTTSYCTFKASKAHLPRWLKTSDF